MLDHRCHDALALAFQRLDDTPNREVVRLCTAGGEDHLVGVAAEERCHLLSRAGDGEPGARAVDVTAGGVAEVIAKEREHGIDDLGQERGRRVVVEVDRIGLGHDEHGALSAAIARNAAPEDPRHLTMLVRHRS